MVLSDRQQLDKQMGSWTKSHPLLMCLVIQTGKLVQDFVERNGRSGTGRGEIACSPFTNCTLSVLRVDNSEQLEMILRQNAADDGSDISRQRVVVTTLQKCSAVFENLKRSDHSHFTKAVHAPQNGRSVKTRMVSLIMEWWVNDIIVDAKGHSCGWSSSITWEEHQWIHPLPTR